MKELVRILIKPYSKYDGEIQVFNGFNQDIEVIVQETSRTAKKVLQKSKVSAVKVALACLMLFGAATANAAEYATWYSTASCQREGTSGVWTASRERFDENAMTCALPTREFGSIWRVTNLKNGKSVVVRQNDKGPGKGPQKRGVVIDLSKGAFAKIADLSDGKIMVKVEKVS